MNVPESLQDKLAEIENEVKILERQEAIETCDICIDNGPVLIFLRPSPHSKLLGILTHGDVVRVQFFAVSFCSGEKVTFLKTCSGSWGRDKRRQDDLFMLPEPCWICLRWNQFHKVLPSLTPLRFVVISSRVHAYRCPSLHSHFEVGSWSRGHVLDVAEVGLNRWLRLSSNPITYVWHGEAHALRQLPDDDDFLKTLDVEKPWHQKAVVYFGICDLKYKRDEPRGCRVKVLELGDGRFSRFSGHGEIIKTNFERCYSKGNMLDRRLLVGNKKVTHDAFHLCGYKQLQPTQACFRRDYTRDLHTQIAKALGIPDKGNAEVVLKLLNRCRGAGVIVSRTGSELDSTLQMLLEPPEGFSCDVADQFTERQLDKALSSVANSMREHCLHWWTNECPVFIAECCAVSHPVAKEDSCKLYNGTLRVGFVLLGSRHGKSSCAHGVSSGGFWKPAASNLDIEFLGGYWKLPSESISSSDIAGRCVSKAKTGTETVDGVDLEDVYNVLRQPLLDVFSVTPGQDFAQAYSEDPLLESFMVARLAAATPHYKQLDEMKLPSQDMLTPDSGKSCNDSIACKAVASHTERQLGCAAACKGDWNSAVEKWETSISYYSFNATAEHLLGYYHLSNANYSKAINHFVRSLSLDPEFKATYVNLSGTFLVARKFGFAVRVAEVGLTRYPFAYQCSYNLGIALVWQLRLELQEKDWPLSVEWEDRKEELFLEWVGKARRATEALVAARDQKESKQSSWLSHDDKILTTLHKLVERLQGKQRFDTVVGMLEDLPNIAGWNLMSFRP